MSALAAFYYSNSAYKRTPYLTLTKSEIKALSSILRDAPPPSTKPTDPKFLTYLKKTRHAISKLPHNLQSSKLKLALQNFAHPAPSHGEQQEVKPGTLCPMHAGLSAKNICSIWLVIREAFEILIGPAIFPLLARNILRASQERKIRALEPVLEMWFPNFDAQRMGFPGKDVIRPMISVTHSDGFVEEIPKWARQGNQCPACMLARIGSDRGVCFALLAGMIARFSSSRVRNGSNRVLWVEGWLKGFEGGKKGVRDAWEFGGELKRLKRQLRDMDRRTTVVRDGGNGSRRRETIVVGVREEDVGSSTVRGGRARAGTVVEKTRAYLEDRDGLADLPTQSRRHARSRANTYISRHDGEDRDKLTPLPAQTHRHNHNTDDDETPYHLPPSNPRFSMYGISLQAAPPVPPMPAQYNYTYSHGIPSISSMRPQALHLPKPHPATSSVYSTSHHGPASTIGIASSASASTYIPNEPLPNLFPYGLMDPRTHIDDEDSDGEEEEVIASAPRGRYDNRQNYGRYHVSPPVSRLADHHGRRCEIRGDRYDVSPPTTPTPAGRRSRDTYDVSPPTTLTPATPAGRQLRDVVREGLRSESVYDGRSPRGTRITDFYDWRD